LTIVTSRTAIAVEEIGRVFLAQPLALQHYLNIHARGDVFIAGHIALSATEIEYQLQRLKIPASSSPSTLHWKCQPIQLHGVKAMSGEQVFESIFQNQLFFNNFHPDRCLTMIRAEFEDWLLVCASTKPEDSLGSRNTLCFTGVSALDVMATVYSNIALYQTSAVYSRNALVDFSRDRKELEDREEIGYEQLVGLFARKIHRTSLPRLGGDVLNIGLPIFKCMFLPCLEATMTVQYSELLGPGELVPRRCQVDESRHPGIQEGVLGEGHPGESRHPGFETPSWIPG
jgi:hypothetical protein